MQHRTFQLANVRADHAGNGQSHLVAQSHLLDLGLALDNGNPRFQIGMADLRDQSPGEPALQPFLDAAQLGGQPVAGEDDLLLRQMEGIEGVEELILRAVLVAEKLDVVYQQNVRRLAVARAKLLHQADAARLLALVQHRPDEVRDELLAGHHRDPPVRVLAMNLVPDGVQEVRLPQPDAPVEEQGVVFRPRRICHHTRCRMTKLVSRADHECLEGVSAV